MNNLANLKFRPVNQTLYFYTNFYQLPRISPWQDFGSLVGRALDCEGSMLREKENQNKSVNILFIMAPPMVSGFLCSVVLPLILVCQLNIIKS